MFQKIPNKFRKFLNPVLALVLGMAILRFVHLGYSEYILDEGIVMTTLKEQGGFSSEFLLNQRKGPLQFVAALIPFTFTHNVYNEFIFRAPYALASVLAVWFFYKFAYSFFKNSTVALFSAFLFGVNGFMVAFGRMIQYQSLNLMFSSGSLYFFSKKKYVWGSVFLALSVLSHWDAVFVLPITLFLFLYNRAGWKNYVLSVVIFCALTLPFLVPYTQKYLADSENQHYFSTRVGSKGLDIAGNFLEYKFKSELYNPFIFLPFILVFSVWAVLVRKSGEGPKKVFAVLGWFITTLVVFLFFVRKPGTHVYNLFIPLSLLAGYGFWKFSDLLSKKAFLITASLLFGFLYLQAYVLFVDHKVEYPFSQERVLFFKTPKYTHKEMTNNVLGFSHYRNWEGINEALVGLGAASYITNEDRSLSNFYMEVPYGRTQGYYVVGAKRPVSFMNDYDFPQIKGKKEVKKIRNKKGDTVAKIYVVKDSEKSE